MFYWLFFCACKTWRLPAGPGIRLTIIPRFLSACFTMPLLQYVIKNPPGASLSIILRRFSSVHISGWVSGEKASKYIMSYFREGEKVSKSMFCFSRWKVGEISISEFQSSQNFIAVLSLSFEKISGVWLTNGRNVSLSIGNFSMPW